ncbi:MAG: c-type cytochrome [Planctomycetes bacterium]|nr:c-type cytochrome [Planctomycetota bacterium]
MKVIRKRGIIAACSVALLIVVGMVAWREARGAVDPPDANKGGQYYAKNCVSCHGTTGAGDGPDHSKYMPPPANLTAIRNTGNMTSSIISGGIPGTAMRGFHVGNMNNLQAFLGKMPLDSSQQWDLPWELQGKTAQQGLAETVYVTSCADCHGIAGDGKGFYAARNPGIWPKPSNFQAQSSDLGRIYYIITNGVPGTFMAPQAPKLSQETRWALAQYVGRFYNGKSGATLVRGSADQASNKYYPLTKDGNPAQNTENIVNPFNPGQTDIVGRGHTIALLYCAYCHGGEVDGTPIAPDLTDRRWLYGNGSDTAVFNVITNGIPGVLMPPHAPLPAEWRWQVITYIRYHGGLPAAVAGYTGSHATETQLGPLGEPADGKPR